MAKAGDGPRGETLGSPRPRHRTSSRPRAPSHRRRMVHSASSDMLGFSIAVIDF